MDDKQPMYIPSSEIFKIVQSEHMGVWSELFDDGLALIIKAPTTVLKAINQGCDVHLIIGLCHSDSTTLAIGISISDNRKSPLLIPMIPRTKREIEGIISLTKQSELLFSAYDEIGDPVLHAKGEINGKLTQEWLKLINESKIDIVDNTEGANKTIESFCYQINPDYGTSKFFEISSQVLNIKLYDIKATQILSINEVDCLAHKLDETNEGNTQETQLSHGLSYLFKKNVYHSPQVTTGTKTRELIDVLTVDERCNFLIESKALCINDSGYGLSHDRRIRGAIKHVKKALRQLEGAIKAIKREDVITNKENPPESVLVDPQKNIHLIVVISEFIQSDEWQEIISKMESLSLIHNAYFHVIDLPEFINTIKLSMSPNISFEISLVQRFTAMIKHRNMYIRGMDSSLPHK